MWVFFLVNLLLHHIRALLMMCRDSFGIFWLRKQQYPKEMLFHLANKIVARKINCALEKRQMEREFVLPPQQGMSIFCSLYILKACIKVICGKYPKYARSTRLGNFKFQVGFCFIAPYTRTWVHQEACSRQNCKCSFFKCTVLSFSFYVLVLLFSFFRQEDKEPSVHENAITPPTKIEKFYHFHLVICFTCLSPEHWLTTHK